MVSRRQPDVRSDAALLADHLGGDRTAFGELFSRHRTRLYHAARRCGSTAEDADDAVQDAMLAAHRAAGSFRNEAAISSWLHRILINSCTDRLRRNAFRSTVELTEDCSAVGDHAGRVDTSLWVRQALLGLPAGQRAAVLAVDIHGYDVAGAAAALGVPEGTVKSRRARAHRRLAVLLRADRPG